MCGSLSVCGWWMNEWVCVMMGCMGVLLIYGFGGM